MSNKFALICTTVLVMLDVAFIIYFIRQPSKDTVHGGLGEALMAMYALGLILIFVLYEISFLIIYFKQAFTALRIMCWLLIGVNVLFGIPFFIDFIRNR
ncbi:MAG: hypothetical protein KF803_12155 [Cyclobacteriaceae bacterium]|nr:hypothetical protein [Cyclobacteriaceae bacterium]